MQATVIDPADIEGLESALEKNNVSIGENSLCIIILLEYAFPVDCLLKKYLHFFAGHSFLYWVSN